MKSNTMFVNYKKDTESEYYLTKFGCFIFRFRKKKYDTVVKINELKLIYQPKSIWVYCRYAVVQLLGLAGWLAK